MAVVIKLNIQILFFVVSPYSSYISTTMNNLYQNFIVSLGVLIIFFALRPIIWQV